MTPTELGKLFLDNYPVNEQGFSPVALVEDLEKICPDFRTKNGCQWARTATSWLGKRFEIERVKKEGRTYSVQLVGFRETQQNHNIPQTVRKNIEKECVVLCIGTNIEIDHKNARYDTQEYQVNDFQALNKTVNDAKRQHCKECRATGCRFDAKRLGSRVSFTKGDLHSEYCERCYWYDPYQFWQEATK